MSSFTDVAAARKRNTSWRNRILAVTALVLLLACGYRLYRDVRVGASLKAVVELDVTDSHVTQAGIDEFRQHVPNREVTPSSASTSIRSAE